MSKYRVETSRPTKIHTPEKNLTGASTRGVREDSDKYATKTICAAISRRTNADAEHLTLQGTNLRKHEARHEAHNARLEQ